MSSSARVLIDHERKIADLSPLLFGGFAEHMGRCIYGGIYEPASPHADAHGLRRDVLAALKELNFSVMRYPGGNFLSGYNWLDGVGPKDQRPRRRDLAWKSIETNQFGTDEFMQFCREIKTKPMMAVNMGTGTIEGASALVEYCNGTPGSKYADLRVANGHTDPYDVAYWCVGNEMDGPWQIGHLEAVEYGQKAREAAKMMRWQDPRVKLIVCGSSGTGMPAYPEWDRTVMELCWEQADYLSMHYYANNNANDLPSYLALTRQFEAHIDTLAGMLRYVKSKQRSNHDVYLSWDEWNVWYKNMEMDGAGQHAPHLIEEVYDLADALAVSLWMNVFLRKSDVLKIACLAQIVNVIAPILTTTDSMVKQTIFYPFQLFSQFARGAALDVNTQAATYATRQYGDVPLLDVSASYDAGDGQTAIFVVNRSETETVRTDFTWQGAAPRAVTGVYQLAGTDPKAANTFEQPNTLLPVQRPGLAVVDNTACLAVPPLSLTVVIAR